MTVWVRAIGVDSRRNARARCQHVSATTPKYLAVGNDEFQADRNWDISSSDAATVHLLIVLSRSHQSQLRLKQCQDILAEINDVLVEQIHAVSVWENANDNAASSIRRH